MELEEQGGVTESHGLTSQQDIGLVGRRRDVERQVAGTRRRVR